jgi:hypothetical protein
MPYFVNHQDWGNSYEFKPQPFSVFAIFGGAP